MKKIIMILAGLVVLLGGIYVFTRPKSYVTEVKDETAYEALLFFS